MTLSVPRGTIEDRTCLGETAVKKALKVLIDHEVLIQEGRPAPGRPARFTLDYRKLAEWLDPGDRQIIRLDNIKPDAGASRLRTPALSAPNAGATRRCRIQRRRVARHRRRVARQRRRVAPAT